MWVFICQEGSIAHISSNCIYFSKEILMLPCYKRTYGSHGQHCSCLLPKRNHMLQWWIQAASLVTVLRTSKTVSVMLRVFVRRQLILTSLDVCHLVSVGYLLVLCDPILPNQVPYFYCAILTKKPLRIHRKKKKQYLCVIITIRSFLVASFMSLPNGAFKSVSSWIWF